MGTYVQINREELEQWLDGLRLHHKWFLMPGKAGVYLLPVGPDVAVKLSSTIGQRHDAMGRGMASMQLALVSTVTGQVLNKKAQGQNHFARTTNWKKNWTGGIERMRDAYMKAQGFYDALALIEDRQKYQHDLLALIQSIPGWQQDHFLQDMNERVARGGILTIKQKEGVEKAARRPASAPPADPAAQADPKTLERLRDLYRAAQRSNDKWLMNFLVQSVVPAVKAGRPLTPGQQQALDRNLGRYRIARQYILSFLGA